MENKAITSESTFLKILSYTADKTVEIANSTPVIGEKIEVDGVLIIPVSKVSAGFAGGGADISDEMKKKTKNPSGMGAKVTVTPTAFLVVDKDRVYTVSVEGESKGGGAAGALAGLIAKIREGKKNKEKKPKKEKAKKVKEDKKEE